MDKESNTAICLNNDTLDKLNHCTTFKGICFPCDNCKSAKTVCWFTYSIENLQLTQHIKCLDCGKEFDKVLTTDELHLMTKMLEM